MSLFFLWKYFERSGQLLLTWQECINRTKMLTTSAGCRGRGPGRGCGRQTTQVVPSLNSPFLDCNNVTSHQHTEQTHSWTDTTSRCSPHIDQGREMYRVGEQRVEFPGSTVTSDSHSSIANIQHWGKNVNLKKSTVEKECLLQKVGNLRM